MITDKDNKKFVFTLKDGQKVNKLGKNIEVYSDGVYFTQDQSFIPKEDIIEILEIND